MGRTLLRIVDSNASLLVLLLANFFFLELIDDPRWGALLSTLLAAVALVVAISDPDAGTTITKRHAISIGACVALAPIVLFVNSASVVGLTYLLPVVLLVTATLPVTISRTLQHRRITHETVLERCALTSSSVSSSRLSTSRWTSCGTGRSSHRRARIRSRSSCTTASSR